nr:undecaprenyl-phosphate glucose phosphotransferase [Desulfobacula sp.]
KKSTSSIIFILDLLIIYACFLGVFVHFNGHISIPLSAVILMAYVGLAWFVIVLNSSITSVNIQSGILLVLRDTLIGYSVLSVSVIGVVALFGEFAPNNKLILWPLLLAIILSLTFRFFYLVILKHFVKHGYQQKSVLLIGGDRVAEKVMNQILSFPSLGYRLYGIVADYYHDTLPKGLYLGKLDRFSEIVRSGLVDEVIIALPLRREQLIIDMVEKCEYEGIRVRIVPDFFRIIQSRAALESLGNIPLIGIRIVSLDLLKNRILKRGFDIVFSLIALAVLSPLLLILVLLIKATSPGPVFFKQKRIGANNVEFDIYKFRSMTVQAKKQSDIVWTTANDSRVSAIGKIMRKTNLDEFPQFWNVLIGNMSVVGPRPEREHFVEEFKKRISHYKVRHLIKSGITGYAQVNGWRGDTSIEKRVECDIHYIENWSFWLDLNIIWLTVFGRKTRKNAY